MQINKLDNVEVNLENGHKYALCNIKLGEAVIKYGFPIGYATADIKKDEHVHCHNLKTGLSDILDYTYTPQSFAGLIADKKYFMGYRRTNGSVGIRNDIFIVPTVGCVNGICELLAKKSGSIAFPHSYGCSQLGEDHKNTQKALAGLVNHPNAGGVLVVSLGCENNTLDSFKTVIGKYDKNRVKFLDCQSSRNEITDGLLLIEELTEYAKAFSREKIDACELIVGLKCGGSDGFSGITANPLVGEFSNLLIARGGSTVLTEVPEMFGAETLLMNRCVDRAIFDKTVSLINSFKKYFIRYDQQIYENPSPGNKAGGITTLEEKSLGCTQKSGSYPIVDVLQYGEPVTKKGLNLLQAPGNDLVASTALSISGCHIVLFTTGRGTPFGSPVPTIKISSNTKLYEHKSNWIDFNAGDILEGKSLTDKANELFEYVIKIANGERKTKSEECEIHDFAIFKDGVTL